MPVRACLQVRRFLESGAGGAAHGRVGDGQRIGRPLGTFLGGASAEIVQRITGSAVAADSSIFLLEIIMLLVALALSFRLD